MIFLLAVFLLVLLFAGAGFAVHFLWWLAVAALIVLVIMAVAGRTRW